MQRRLRGDNRPVDEALGKKITGSKGWIEIDRDYRERWRQIEIDIGIDRNRIWNRLDLEEMYGCFPGGIPMT